MNKKEAKKYIGRYFYDEGDEVYIKILNYFYNSDFEEYCFQILRVDLGYLDSKYMNIEYTDEFEINIEFENLKELTKEQFNDRYLQARRNLDNYIEWSGRELKKVFMDLFYEIDINKKIVEKTEKEKKEYWDWVDRQIKEITSKEDENE